MTRQTRSSNTNIPRLTPIRLGKRFVGFDADEVNAQNRALIAHSRRALAEPVNGTDQAADFEPPSPSAVENSVAQEPRRRRLPQREVS
jgi:hypothetical protein